MEESTVNVARAKEDELRAECERLGIAVTARTTLAKLKSKIRAYKQNYTLYKQWLKLAEMLWPEGHDIDTTNHDTVIDGVHERLFVRLVEDGWYGSFSTRADRILYDSANDQSFVILTKQGVRNLNTRVFAAESGFDAGSSGSCNMLFAARCAFPDVETTYQDWEAWKASAE